MVITATLRSRCRHYILPCGLFFFLLLLFFFSRLISAVAEWISTILLHEAPWKYRTQKRRKKSQFLAPSQNFVVLYLRNYGMYRQSEKMLSSNMSSTCPHNITNIGPLAAEIVSLVWGTPANFFFFFSSPNLSGRKLDVYHWHMMWP